MVRKKKTRRPKELSVNEIDYVGYNAVLSTQLLIAQLKQLQSEILAVKVLVSQVLDRLPENKVPARRGRLSSPIVLKGRSRYD